MSNDAPGPRPRQVTVGGWVVAVASALLVVTVFDTMTHLHSVDTRDALTKALTTGSGKDLGISVADALTVIRAALFVAGVAAATTAVLGVFVLQRHTAARIVLTIAAVPIAVSTPIGGGGAAGSDTSAVFLLGMVIAAATILLWTEPARDWFAGRQPRPAVTVAARSGTWPPGPPPAPAAPPRVAPPSSTAEPRPVPGWGRTSPPPAAPFLSSPPPVGSAPVPGAGSSTVRSRVPGVVRAACLLTWAFSGLTAAAYVLIVFGAAVDRDGVLKVVHDSGVVNGMSWSDDQIIGVLVALSAFVIVWCVVASLLAALVWRRVGWARIVLLVSCGVAAAFMVAAVPVSVAHLAAATAVFVLLLRPSARAWFGGETWPVTVASMQDWPPPTGSPAPPEPPQLPSDKPPVW